VKEILINYEAVRSKTTEMRNYLNNDLLTHLDNEYRQIQSILDNVDGATNARLKKEMEVNRRKSAMAARTLDKLISFIANSAKEFEQKEKEIARAFASGADSTKGDQ